LIKIDNKENLKELAQLIILELKKDEIGQFKDLIKTSLEEIENEKSNAKNKNKAPEFEKILMAMNRFTETEIDKALYDEYGYTRILNKVFSKDKSLYKVIKLTSTHKKHTAKEIAKILNFSPRYVEKLRDEAAEKIKELNRCIDYSGMTPIKIIQKFVKENETYFSD